MKNNKIVLLVISLLSFARVDASHISGGDIIYECVGQDSFLVTLNLFRDCAGIALPNAAQLNFSSTCGNSVSANLVLQSTAEVSVLCPSQIANSTCNGGSWPGVQMVSFSGIVVLSSPCNTWTLNWTSCCRNMQVSNLVNPGGTGTYLFATLNSGIDSCQSSPYFTSIPAPYVCLNTQVDYNVGVIDLEGDSVVYTLSPAYEDANTLTAYFGTYSYLQPISGNNLVLDSATGQISFTPTAVGVYVLVVRVEKYDRISGLLKGTIMRDLQVVVQNCINAIPEVDSPGIYNLNGATLVDSNSMEACLGHNLSFDIAISDTNLADTISISHNIYQALDSTALVTITPGNPSIVNVSWTPRLENKSFYNFSITALDDACPVRGMMVTSFDIQVNPSAYAGEDEVICFGDSVQLQASGGSSFVWSVISGSPMVTHATCFQCADPIVNPSVTTTYLLVSNTNNVNCSNLDTVVVNVVPSFTLNLTSDTSVCDFDSLQLVATVNPTGSNYSYNWQSSSALSDSSISNPFIFPTQPEIFKIRVSSGLGCYREQQVSIGLLKGIPNSFTLSADSVICVGDTVNLEVDFPTTVSASCGVMANQVSGVINQGVIGVSATTTTTSTSFPSVYGRFYWGVKHQIIYTKTELLQMGMEAGSVIKSIGFDVTSLGSPSNMDQLTVRIGCTSDSAFVNSYLPGLQTVVHSHQYYPVLGWNTHSFSQDYVWDGQSNIVVELCSNNSNYSSASTSNTRYTSTVNNTVAYFRADNANVCSGTTVTTSVDRPNTKFEYVTLLDSTLYNYSWSPVPAQLNALGFRGTDAPLVNTVYSVTISDSVGVCTQVISQNVQVNSVPFDAGFIFDSTICEGDSSVQLLPISIGGIFTGTGVDVSGSFSPLQTGAGSWPINYNVGYQTVCANDSTIWIDVIGTPDATIIDQEACINSSAVNLQSATSGGVWRGFFVSDSILGIADFTGLPAGNYEVYYEIDSPCYSKDTGYIFLTEPYSFTLNNISARVCEDGVIDLNNEVNISGNPLQGTSPYWSFYNTDGYVDAFGIFDAEPANLGLHNVAISIADSNGNCGTTQTLGVIVDPVEKVEISDPISFCESQTQGRIFVNPWLFGAGVSYTQKPLGNLGINDTLTILPYGQNGEFNPSLVGVGSWEITIEYENVYGCVGILVDTIYVLDPPTNGVTNMGNYLNATAGLGYNYQWLDCDNNNMPIAGATSATYTPGRKGRFAVQVKAGECEAVSDCFETWPVAVNDLKSNARVSVHPNPAQNRLTVSIPFNEHVIIEILDNSGKLVLKEESDNLEKTFSVENLVSGVYIIRVQGPSILFTEKLIIQ